MKNEKIIEKIINTNTSIDYLGGNPIDIKPLKKEKKEILINILDYLIEYEKELYQKEN